VSGRAAVLGSPVAHSLSPVIHRAAYDWLGLDWSYEKVELEREAFAPFVDGLDASWRGLSVTMPLKEEAARCGEPDDDVVLTGVANTVVLEADGRRVYNTDIPGLIAALTAAGVSQVRAATLVGNGATARSALVGLVRLGAEEVDVVGRDPQRVQAFLDWAHAALPVEVHARTWGAPLDPGDDVLVSTIPAAGMDNLLDHLGVVGEPGELGAVFDVIYHPWPTPLAARAATAGATVVSGLDLLVHQAAHQVRLMTGRDVPVDVLMSAVRAELQRRSQS
jgi:shikimate dehydrogenase